MATSLLILKLTILSIFVGAVRFYEHFTLSFKLSGDPHMPVVILENLTPGNHAQHAAVLQENNIFGRGSNSFVKIKNTYTDEPTIEVKLDMTPNPNGWALAANICLYIQFH